MKEISFIGLDMAMEHAAFQMFKNVKTSIGIIVPKFEMLRRHHEELVFNIRSISDKSIIRLTERTMILNNGSTASFFVHRQDSDMSVIRGHQFNIFFSLYNAIPYEFKLALIPQMIMEPDTKIYEVFDR
jgi:hypothetical protein